MTTHASSLRPRAPPPPRHPESILGWLPSRKETQGGRGKSAPAGDWARTRRAPRENGGDAAVTPASPRLSPPRTQPRRREQLLSPLSRFILGATYWPPQSAESPGLLERLQTKPQKGSTLAGSGARRSRGGRARARGLARPLRAPTLRPLSPVRRLLLLLLLPRLASLSRVDKTGCHQTQ